jgi:hypothetical protein
LSKDSIMAKKALSERVKSQKQSKLKEKKILEAVEAYRAEQAKPGTQKGVRAIAKEHGIEKCYKTIINRYNNMRSTAEAHEDQQKLTAAEEAVLVDFLMQSADRGFPQSRRNIAQYANLIRNNRLGKDCTQIGDTWVGRFLERHRDGLQMHWSKPLDTQRAQSMNPEAKKKWFELLEEFVVKAGIRPEDLYGMDETGCPPSDQGTERVCGGRGTKTQHKQGGADRENVTAIVTICADGTTLRPTIIFKGQNFMTKWADNNVANAS